MGIQARNVVRLAKKLNQPLKRMDYRYCAVGFLAQRVNIDEYHRKELAQAYRVPQEGIAGVEFGFEGWTRDNDPDFFREYGENQVFKKYYKVGQNIARLAGLPPM